ncbi:MAG: hypothetical protein HYW57_07830 [Ignavibacteriales bacterium]|nr:hypothetical protein [Ignavibacteriales bacterium]
MRRVPLLLLLVLCGLEAYGQEKGRVSFLAYADYFYHLQRDSGLTNVALNGSEGFNGFQFRRIYLTFDYAVLEGFQSRFRLEADESALTSDGKIGVFVKDAYLSWKNAFGRNDLTFGIQPTPAFETSEAAWGFRSVEKTIMDLRGLAGSRDFGIALQGTMDPAGRFGYWLLIANGTGNRPESDKLKRYYARIIIQPIEDITVTVYGDYNDRPDILSPYTGKGVSNSALTSAVFVGARPVERVRIGVEGVFQTTLNEFDTGLELTSRDRIGISAFARWTASEKLEFLGRYDYFDPNGHSSSTRDTRGYLIAGVAWSPAGNVRVIPNIQMETLETTVLRSYVPSVTGRVTLVWNFP